MSAFRCKADITIAACLLLRSLLGVKRTSHFAAHMSAYDPKRTSRSVDVGFLRHCFSTSVSGFDGEPFPRGACERRSERGRQKVSTWRLEHEAPKRCCERSIPERG